ncbi:MAG: hypothetical protein HZA50_17650 [Planctomycetes bacterium]|nr:hypothetical protein [Planctomycetota bacterium]
MNVSQLISRLNELPPDAEVRIVFPDIVNMSASLPLDARLRIEADRSAVYLVAEDTSLPSDAGDEFGVAVEQAGKEK